MTTKPTNPRTTAREDWAETRTTRKGKPSHRAKHHEEAGRAWKQYARTL